MLTSISEEGSTVPRSLAVEANFGVLCVVAVGTSTAADAEPDPTSARKIPCSSFGFKKVSSLLRW
jgi:hypothetical protein